MHLVHDDDLARTFGGCDRGDAENFFGLFLENGRTVTTHFVNVGVHAAQRHVVGAMRGVIHLGQKQTGECSRSFFFATTLGTHEQVCMNGLGERMRELIDGAILTAN